MAEFLKPFQQFGIVFTSNNGNQHYADCPFSGKEGKFVVNEDNGLWDSKTTGKSGNVLSFIRQFYTELINNTEAIDLKPLADKKELPTWLFVGCIAYNPLNDTYVIPYRDSRGEIMNIGHYSLSSKVVIKTKGLKQLPLGLDDMITSDNNIVYITEGEWDYFAMKWLVKRNGLKHNVIGLTGANVFKDEWVEFFKDREVYSLMDHDEAGRNGSDRIKKMLSSTVVQLKYLIWPGELLAKYDIRDFILTSCGDLTSFKTKHKGCYANLMKMMHTDTPNELINGVINIPEPQQDVVIPTIKEVETVFRKWFKMKPDDYSLDIMLGTCLANKIPGDPVWLYMVGSPGSRKTAMLMSLNKSSYIETVSTLTPAALVSGMRAIGSEDPSLIPKLNNRMLVIKDVTTILSGATFVRDEIFGMLRDAFDGYIEKIFGNGLKKSFKSKFGVLGAVTPVIDGYQSHQAILGERFLKFRLDSDMKVQSEYEIIERTLDNIQEESLMNEEMQNIVCRMLQKNPPEIRINFNNEDLKKRLIYMGVCVAKMRGSLNINPYTREQLSKPITEIGTRITKQLNKLAMGIAILHDHKTITEYEMERCRQVAIDTCPDRTEMIVRLLYQSQEDVTTQEIINFTSLSAGTISAMLITLVSLKIIKRVHGYERSKSSYALRDNMKFILNSAEIFDVNVSIQNNGQIDDNIAVRSHTKIKIKSKAKNEESSKNESISKETKITKKFKFKLRGFKAD